MRAPLFAALAGALWLGAARAQGPALVPREVLFRAPEKERARLSPDGKLLGHLAPDARGARQIWVQQLPGGAPWQLSRVEGGELLHWAWTEDGASVLYTAGADGDAVHLFSVDLATRARRDLTPWAGVRAALLGTSAKVPEQALVLLNQRDRRLFDVHRVNLKTGAVALDTRNPGEVVAWAHDEALQVRAALARTSDGGTELKVRDSVRSPWRALVKTTADEQLLLLGLAFDGKGVFLATTVSADTTRVIEKNLVTGVERALGASPTSDLRDWLYNPGKLALQAAAFDEGGQKRWVPLEPSVVRDLEQLAQLGPGALEITSRDRADALWTVALDADRAGARTWLWERAARRATLLFAANPALAALPLAETRAVTVPARDGLALPAFLTRPPGAAGGAPTPLVLLVHPGPDARDAAGFDPRVQLFANRGYAVLQVNFRGSTGYGKRFAQAGHREWGRRLQDDLADAARWAVQQQIADPARVALYGEGYGGYAALAGLTQSPELYRCAVDVSGPIDLAAQPAAFAAWEWPDRLDWLRRVGNPDLPADRARLEQAGPLGLLGRLRGPVLIAQSAGDARVRAADLQRLVAGLEAAGAAATVVVYPGQEPPLARLPGRLDLFARVEAFFAGCLGGRAEPMPATGLGVGAAPEVRALPAKATPGPR